MNPVGRRIRRVDPGATNVDARGRVGDTGPWLEIVGVVEDFSDAGGVRTFYQPLPLVPEVAPVADNRAGSATPPQSLAIHAADADPRRLSNRLREIAAAVDADLLVDPIRSMDAVWESYWLEDVALASGLGGLMLGLVLFSAAGIYTLLAFTVVQRRREIGIRSALGRRPGS